MIQVFCSYCGHHSFFISDAYPIEYTITKDEDDEEVATEIDPPLCPRQDNISCVCAKCGAPHDSPSIIQ